MCDIGGISDTEGEWEDIFTKKGESISVVNGREYKLDFDLQKDRVVSSLFKIKSEECRGRNHFIQPMAAEVRAELKATFDWGGDEGVKFQGGSQLEFHDGNGNYANINITQDNTGQGRVEVAVGHKEEKKE